MFSQVLGGGMQAEREAQGNVLRPLPVDTLWVEEMGIQLVDTTLDTLPNSYLLTVETGEVRMEPV